MEPPAGHIFSHDEGAGITYSEKKVAAERAKLEAVAAAAAAAAAADAAAAAESVEEANVNIQVGASCMVDYDYDDEEETQLQLKVGEAVSVSAVGEEGWLFGATIDGREGWFPSGYVSLTGYPDGAPATEAVDRPPTPATPSPSPSRPTTPSPTPAAAPSSFISGAATSEELGGGVRISGRSLGDGTANSMSER
jgi:hypothetical protein